MTRNDSYDCNGLNYEDLPFIFEVRRSNLLLPLKKTQRKGLFAFGPVNTFVQKTLKHISQGDERRKYLWPKKLK